jgi:hypothetical protein
MPAVAVRQRPSLAPEWIIAIDRKVQTRIRANFYFPMSR